MPVFKLLFIVCVFGSNVALAIQTVSMDYSDRIVLERKNDGYSFVFCHLHTCQEIGPFKRYSKDQLRKIMELIEKDKSAGNAHQLLYDVFQPPKSDLFVIGKISSGHLAVTNDSHFKSLKAFLTGAERSNDKNSYMKHDLSNENDSRLFSSDYTDAMAEVKECRDYFSQLVKRAFGEP